MMSVIGISGVAFAQAGAGQAAGPIPFYAHPLFMMGIIFAIIYFLIMRPQQKKQREHQQVLRNLKKGDRVVTMSGMHGTIANLDEKTISLRVDDKVRIKFSRASVSGISDDEPAS
jgi:preprotein translocase subunit YajC